MNDDWKQKLTPEQYYVLREKGTERPFTGKYDLHFEEGSYYCAGCGSKLFDSGSKYDSGCGWPAFYKTADKGAIIEKLDRSHGMIRTEVLCANCGGHLGHVFPDGPQDKTGMRYCINSISLEFKSEQ
jgi:peptide-methionine (R)-S-oxide reductase